MVHIPGPGGVFDPNFFPHLVGPISAHVKGIAEGELGDTVGVFGSTVSGVGLWGQATAPGGLAGKFEGNVEVGGSIQAPSAVIGNIKVTVDLEVAGDIRLANADCAEDFDISSLLQLDPGTVMVLDGDGALSESRRDYDKRVAGVISGAGDYKPGIVLDSRRSSNLRQPVALMGKVYCKVDADLGAIEAGDLLTTSPTPGHAMKATDQARAFGAVIGKALRPLAAGRGLVAILVALQ